MPQAHQGGCPGGAMQAFEAAPSAAIANRLQTTPTAVRGALQKEFKLLNGTASPARTGDPQIHNLVL
jgi:hypothetical protein